MNVRTMLVAVLCATIWLVPGFVVSNDAAAADEVETARQLVALLKLSCSLVSEHQAEINDPAKGDKGFTPAFVGETITTRFWNQEHIDLSSPMVLRRAHFSGACWNARRMWWRPIKW